VTNEAIERATSRSLPHRAATSAGDTVVIEAASDLRGAAGQAEEGCRVAMVAA
jgi:hypothetical protein